MDDPPFFHHNLTHRSGHTPAHNQGFRNGKTESLNNVFMMSVVRVVDIHPKIAVIISKGIMMDTTPPAGLTTIVIHNRLISNSVHESSSSLHKRANLNL